VDSNPVSLEAVFEGPIHLSASEIAKNVPAGAPGAYALGYARPHEGAVFIALVGRGDTDLRAALLERVEGAYTACFWRISATAEEAFARECELWHEMGGAEGDLDSDLHPVPPGDLACPVCGS